MQIGFIKMVANMAVEILDRMYLSSAFGLDMKTNELSIHVK